MRGYKKEGPRSKSFSWNNLEKSVESKVSRIKSFEGELNNCIQISKDFIDDTTVEKANEVLLGSTKEVFAICNQSFVHRTRNNLTSKTIVYYRL